jgi:hypothetical protein
MSFYPPSPPDLKGPPALFSSLQLSSALFSSLQLSSALFSSLQLSSALFSSLQLSSALFSFLQLFTALHSSHISSQIFTNLHKSSQIFTNLHKSSQIFTDLHKSSQIFTNLHRSSQLCTSFLFTALHFIALHSLHNPSGYLSFDTHPSTKHCSYPPLLNIFFTYLFCQGVPRDAIFVASSKMGIFSITSDSHTEVTQSL